LNGERSLSGTHRSSEPIPRRSHGLLWGCLGIVLLIVAGAGGAALYGYWVVHEGFHNDPALQHAMTEVRSNRIAQDVLGGSIVIESMESETFSTATGKGKTVTYALHVKGDKAEGELHILLHSSGHEMKIVSMVLTGPDDERYNLTGAEGLRPSGAI
jgi:cytochrome oxidase complex assembly protein 1